ncbi:hypothetical protein [Nonomuraea maritima]|uniref:hypothetical protein n=1 Tax=Nonomuraea maritima TaxID=683260 RepID=UPI0015A22237|nr:hypothetical protein [Nonomuraea maritima]
MRRACFARGRRGRLAVLTADGLDVLRAAAPAHVACVREHLVDVLTGAQLGGSARRRSSTWARHRR